MRNILIVLGMLLFLAIGCSKDGPWPDKSDYLGGKPPMGTELWCEKTAENGKSVRHGPYSEWYTATQKKIEGQYANDEMDGKWTYWYKNGKKHREGNYKAGKYTGVWTTWFKSGKKKNTGEWKDGVACCNWTYFRENGSTMKEGGRDNKGRRDGTWVYYYSNGKKKEGGMFKEDKKVGIWKTWDAEGKEESVNMDEPAPDSARLPKTDDNKMKKDIKPSLSNSANK